MKIISCYCLNCPIETGDFGDYSHTMSIAKRNMIVLIMLLLGATVNVGAVELSDFKMEFQSVVDGWANGDMDSESLVDIIPSWEGRVNLSLPRWEQLYWQARFALLRGQVYFEQENKRKSISELEICLSLAEESATIEAFSDSWRIMSEASSLLMLQKGMFYIIANFSTGQDQAKTALSIDPENARASLVIAQFLCNAPSIAGGDMDDGIQILSKLSIRTDLIDEDLFYVLLTLSQSQYKNKQVDDALVSCRRAMEIFPGNETARQLLLELQSEKS